MDMPTELIAARRTHALLALGGGALCGIGGLFVWLLGPMEFLQPGEDARPMLLSLLGAAFVSHIAASGLLFRTLTGGEHVQPGMAVVLAHAFAAIFSAAVVTVAVVVFAS